MKGKVKFCLFLIKQGDLKNMWEQRNSAGNFNINIRLRSVFSFSPRSFFSGERATDTQWKGGSVEPRAGMDISGKGMRKKT